MKYAIGCLLVASTFWGGSNVSAQEPRVVALDFAGKGGDKARIQVIRALRDRAVFETKSDAERALKKSGLSGSTVAGRAAVAAALPVDYVIYGNVRGQGSKARAKIRIAGPQGREIASRQAGPPGTSKGNARIQNAARALLSKALATVPPATSRRKSRGEPSPAAAAAPAAPVAATTTSPAPQTAKPVEPAAAEVEEPVAIRIEARSGGAKLPPYVTLLGGVGGRIRSIEVRVDDGVGGTGTRTYDSGVYLDIVFRLEVRPLAKHAVRGLRGLALEADGDFGVGLKTQPPGSNASLDTQAWRVLGQLGYFHRFDKGELGGLLGVGYDRLKLEENGTLPSIGILFLRVGPAYRHFFLDRQVYLRVDGGFRYPFSYGELEDTFGDGSGVGFDAALTLGGELDVGFAYAARLSFDYFKPRFAGFPDGELPPLPGAAQGRDATDFGINFHVMVGWAF